MGQDILKVFSSNIARMFVAIMTTFFLPWMLDVESYAFVKLYQLYVSYIGFMHLGVCDGVYLKYGGKDITDNIDIISIEENTMMLFQIIISAVCVIIGAMCTNFVIVVWGFTIFPRNMRTFYEYIYQATGEFDKYSKIVKWYSFSSVVLYVVLIFIFKSTNPKNYISGLCVMDFVAYLYACNSFGNKRNRNFKLDFKLLFSNFKQGIFLMIGNFANTIFLSIDKLFVKTQYGMEEFGYYSFATQLLLLITMFVTPISLTLYNYFSKNKNVEFEKNIKKHTVSFVFLILLLSFFVKLIVENFISKYEKSLDIFFVLLLANVISSISTILYVNLYKTYKLQKKYLLNLLVIILLSLVLNLLAMVLFHSSLGFAYATLVSMIIMLFLNMREFSHLKFATKEYVFIILIIVGYIFLIGHSRVILSFAIFIVYYFIVLYFTSKEELTYICQYILRIVKK